MTDYQKIKKMGSRYNIIVIPNTDNKSKWYYGNGSRNLSGKIFNVTEGVGFFEGEYAIRTNGGSGGTLHFSKDDVEVIIENICL